MDVSAVYRRSVYPRFFGRAHLGAISGLFMTVIVVASAVGPFLFSLAESFLGAYRAGFAFSSVAARSGRGGLAAGGQSVAAVDGMNDGGLLSVRATPL